MSRAIARRDIRCQIQSISRVNGPKLRERVHLRLKGPISAPTLNRREIEVSYSKPNLLLTRGVFVLHVFLAMRLLTRMICREEPVFAGKVICGVRIETSAQSWPSKVYRPCRRIESLRECLSDQAASKKHDQYRYCQGRT